MQRMVLLLAAVVAVHLASAGVEFPIPDSVPVGEGQAQTIQWTDTVAVVL